MTNDICILPSTSAVICTHSNSTIRFRKLRICIGCLTFWSQRISRHRFFKWTQNTKYRKWKLHSCPKQMLFNDINSVIFVIKYKPTCNCNGFETIGSIICVSSHLHEVFRANSCYNLNVMIPSLETCKRDVFLKDGRNNPQYFNWNSHTQMIAFIGYWNPLMDYLMPRKCHSSQFTAIFCNWWEYLIYLL